MHLVRPVRETDLASLTELVTQTGVGMTSLPRNAEALEARIAASRATFADGPQGLVGAERGLLLVLEDTRSGAVVGTSGLHTGIGLGEPFYSYRVSTVVHASRALGVHRVIPTLYLNNDYTGCAEIGSLFLGARVRGSGLGRLLSRCRFLLFAAHPNAFPDKIVAEMRGRVDDRGRSPFWDGVGRHFFSMPFRRADYLSGTRGKTFIAELMPRNPIYVPLLPPAAQRAIGEVHPDTRQALRLLQAEGFHYEGYVDIFDGGPTVEARRAEIGAVRHSRVLTVVAESPGERATTCLVASGDWADFRCTQAPLAVDGARARLDPAVLAALGISTGERVRAVPLATDARGTGWTRQEGENGSNGA